jgi:alkylhydroperoxidase/carboxymuconolactone decarboxylase family protein YurZ
MKNQETAETLFLSDEVRQRNPDMAALLALFGDKYNTTAVPFWDTVFEMAGFDLPTRELIMIATVVMRGWRSGLDFHASLSLDAAGLTPDQIRGAILCTLPVGGVATAAQGLTWFEDYMKRRADNK